MTARIYPFPTGTALRLRGLRLDVEAMAVRRLPAMGLLVSIDEALCHFFSGNPSDKRREVRVARRLIAVEVVARGPTAGGVTWPGRRPSQTPSWRRAFGRDMALSRAIRPRERWRPSSLCHAGAILSCLT